MTDEEIELLDRTMVRLSSWSPHLRVSPKVLETILGENTLSGESAT